VGGFFGTLASFFSKLGTLTTYITRGISTTYQGFGTSQKFAMYMILLILVLMAIYVIALILRFNFKVRTRKLNNIRLAYQIEINRAEGKRCNFIWDILLYQKMVVLDDPLLQELENKQELLIA
jgi:hypothetical protein